MGQSCCNAPPPSKSESTGTASDGPLVHSAFVFIKPHAVTSSVKELVRKKLEAANIRVLQDKQIDAETIDEKKYIDKHYGAIASRAVLQQPAELVVQEAPKKEFEKLFGLTWDDALQKGLVFNAADAAGKLGIKPLEVSERFDKLERGKDQIKFGGGFYVGKLDDIYVVNGFYTRMRAKYTTPGVCIHCFEVEWDPAALSWKKFRAEIIGATNPKEAAEGSIRQVILADWSNLGLSAEPDTGDNGAHASASPFEGLAEKSNWLGVSIGEDPLGKAFQAAGVPLSHIEAWTGDPAVMLDDKKQSLFDLFEDVDVSDCVDKASAIYAANK